VASSASREESEEMYSGVSSVPMVSSGRRSRLKENEEEVKHEITQESKKQVKGKLTLEWCFLWGAVRLGLLAFVHGLGVFSSEAGEKMRSDG
jgi:hypothetical protein